MSARALQRQRTPRLELECGAVLTDVVQAYHLDGALSPARDNLVLVFHALTGSADAAGDWWRELVGPGRAIDTRRYAVLCANLLGSCYGTTGPADGGDFPPVTPRDQARLIHHLLDGLGIEQVALATGGSLGGMVALEWAAQQPARARAVVAFAAPAAHTARAIAWNHVQRRAIEAGGPVGLEVARMVGMMTYRTPAEQSARFGRRREADGGWAIGSYLDHHGRKLRDRFDVRSYLALLGAMDAHDVGRGRGGVAAALRPLGDRLTGVGIPGDRLYGAEDVRAWVEAAGGHYREIHSTRGHDAFLLEPGQVGEILAEALRRGEPTGDHLAPACACALPATVGGGR